MVITVASLKEGNSTSCIYLVPGDRSQPYKKIPEKDCVRANFNVVNHDIYVVVAGKIVHSYRH